MPFYPEWAAPLDDTANGSTTAALSPHVAGRAIEAIKELTAERDQLRLQVDEASRWHTSDARMGHDDVRCASCQEETWPCPTARALGLDGESP